LFITALDVPGSCLAGYYASDAIKITVRAPDGTLLSVWETALTHELIHALGWIGEGEQLAEIASSVNGKMREWYP
jgi:hypothetical protein